MEIIYTSGMITINETMIVVLVSFLLLVFILNRLMFRPLLNTIDERNNCIQGLSQDITTLKKQSEQLTNQLHDREEQARQEAFAQKKELEALGSQQASDISEQTRQEMQAIKAKAQQEVDAQYETAKKQIQQEAETLAADIMEKILERKVG
ncbi:MAG: hypothetical protein SWH61_14905 [Thermodesulfobacteriota bacterium]|nr:hypothetical protein [Thermodesulfobacteriota bacterium]